MGILDKKDNGVSQLLGSQHQWAVNLHKKSVALNWTPDDIPSNVDKQQWDGNALSPAEKHLIKRTLGLFAAGESLVSNSGMFIESQYITDGAMRQYLARKIYEECLTGDHKVLTDRGWKFISEINVGDFVASYSDHEKSISYSQVHLVSSYIDRCVFSWRSKQTTIKSSLNHRHLMPSNGVTYTAGEPLNVKYESQIDKNDLPILSLDIKKGYVRPSAKALQNFYTIIFDRIKVDDSDKEEYSSIYQYILQNLEEFDVDQYHLDDGVYILSNVVRSHIFAKALGELSKVSSKGCEAILRKLRRCGYRITKSFYSNDPEKAQLINLLHFYSGKNTYSTITENEDGNYCKTHNAKNLKFSKSPSTLIESVFCLTVDEGNFVAQTPEGTIFLTGNSIHALTATSCCDWFSLSITEVAEAYKNIPSIAKKEAFIMQSLSQFDTALDIKDPENIRRFIRNIFIIYMIVEGMWFIANFIAILSLKRRNLLPGLGKQILYTWRDEENHVYFGIELLKILKLEYPDSFPSEEELGVLMDQALQIEADYINDILAVPLDGYTAKDALDFAMYQSNVNLQSIGLKLRYPIVSQPIDWLHEVTGDQLTAFFEQRETNYKSTAILDDDY